MDDEEAPPAALMAEPTAMELLALEALRFNWGDAYELGFDPGRGWWAKRRDGMGGYLLADGPEGLGSAIREDYALRPVPREYDPRQAPAPGAPGCGDRA